MHKGRDTVNGKCYGENQAGVEERDKRTGVQGQGVAPGEWAPGNTEDQRGGLAEGGLEGGREGRGSMAGP